MQIFLITMAGAGLLGCFATTLGVDLAQDIMRGRQQLRRPPMQSVGQE